MGLVRRMSIEKLSQEPLNLDSLVDSIASMYDIDETDVAEYLKLAKPTVELEERAIREFKSLIKNPTRPRASTFKNSLHELRDLANRLHELPAVQALLRLTDDYALLEVLKDRKDSEGRDVTDILYGAYIMPFKIERFVHDDYMNFVTIASNVISLQGKKSNPVARLYLDTVLDVVYKHPSVASNTNGNGAADILESILWDDDFIPLFSEVFNDVNSYMRLKEMQDIRPIIEYVEKNKSPNILKGTIVPLAISYVEYLEDENIPTRQIASLLRPITGNSDITVNERFVTFLCENPAFSRPMMASIKNKAVATTMQGKLHVLAARYALDALSNDELFVYECVASQGRIGALGVLLDYPTWMQDTNAKNIEEIAIYHPQGGEILEKYFTEGNKLFLEIGTDTIDTPSMTAPLLKAISSHGKVRYTKQKESERKQRISPLEEVMRNETEHSEQLRHAQEKLSAFRSESLLVRMYERGKEVLYSFLDHLDVLEETASLAPFIGDNTLVKRYMKKVSDENFHSYFTEVLRRGGNPVANLNEALAIHDMKSSLHASTTNATNSMHRTDVTLGSTKYDRVIVYQTDYSTLHQDQITAQTDTSVIFRDPTHPNGFSSHAIREGDLVVFDISHLPHTQCHPIVDHCKKSGIDFRRINSKRELRNILYKIG